MTRVVLVTGGGTGIGAATAAREASGGARVVIVGRREAPLAEVASRTGAQVMVADLAEPEQVDRVVDEIRREHGRLDGVVCNAGIMRAGSVGEASIEDWDASIAVNLRAPFLLARASLPLLVAARGAFVSISSIAAIRAAAGAAPYCVAKAGLTMLTQSIAVDYAAQGVRANVVCPGWVRTEMGDEEMAEFGEPLGLDVEAAYGEVARLVPARRVAQASEIADVVHWLLGPESSYVNGAVIVADGGTTIVDPGTVPLGHSVAPR